MFSPKTVYTRQDLKLHPFVLLAHGEAWFKRVTLSADVLKVFEDNFTFFRMAESHVLCYPIPSERGDMGVGKRRLNWVWYWNMTEAELDSVLTDANGVLRAYAIPPGALHLEQEARQRRIAEQVLPPAFKELLRATKEPFVQAIMDLA